MMHEHVCRTVRAHACTHRHTQGHPPDCRPIAAAISAVEKKEKREERRVAPRISGAWRFMVSRCW